MTDSAETHAQRAETDRPALAPQAEFARCPDCGSPVADDQRYCVGCGSRQTQVSNPAVEYFSAAAANRRARIAPAGSAWAQRAPLLALLFVLVPLAALVGVLVGRHATDDRNLIAALRSQKPVVVMASPGQTAPGAASPAAAAAVVRSATGATGSTGAVGAQPPPVTRSTGYGTVQRIAGSKVTATQVAQGGRAVAKINKAVGQSYVKATQSLPGTVVVPSASAAPSGGTGQP